MAIWYQNNFLTQPLLNQGVYEQVIEFDVAFVRVQGHLRSSFMNRIDQFWESFHAFMMSCCLNYDNGNVPNSIRVEKNDH